MFISYFCLDFLVILLFLFTSCGLNIARFTRLLDRAALARAGVVVFLGVVHAATVALASLYSCSRRVISCVCAAASAFMTLIDCMRAYGACACSCDSLPHTVRASTRTFVGRVFSVCAIVIACVVVDVVFISTRFTSATPGAHGASSHMTIGGALCTI